ncbi:hypothetical protein MKW92_016064, partial [Papaver armeniacum]
MTGAGVGNKSEEPLLLQQNIISTEESSTKYIEGMVNYKGEKLLKMINNQQVGGWKSAIPLIVIGGTD